MSKERTANSSNGLMLSIDEIIITHRFVRTIETAHKNGVAFLLALQLVSMLQHYYEKYGSITAPELEGLIVEAAEAMIKEPPG